MLLTYSRKQQVVTVNYFSHYPEVPLLLAIAASQVIRKQKSIFARHAVSEVVQTNHSLQFMWHEFKNVSQVCDGCR